LLAVFIYFIASCWFSFGQPFSRSAGLLTFFHSFSCVSFIHIRSALQLIPIFVDFNCWCVLIQSVYRSSFNPSKATIEPVDRLLVRVHSFMWL